MDLSTLRYRIRWTSPERGTITVNNPYTGLPESVQEADYDEATAILESFDPTVDDDWEEIDRETIRLHSAEEAESSVPWIKAEEKLVNNYLGPDVDYEVIDPC